MHKFFSTEESPGRDVFRDWRETIYEQFWPIGIHRLNEDPFSATVEGFQIDTLKITRLSNPPASYAQTADDLRKSNINDDLTVGFALKGTGLIRQYDRDCVQHSGGLFLLDKAPFSMEKPESNTVLVMRMPRARIENALGPAKTYSSLTANPHLSSTSLALNFFKELIKVHKTLNPSVLERMSLIGQDLIIASLAERLAMELPRSIHSTVTVQRAKAYVEANLSDPKFDPRQLALAMSISLRRLQELFHQRNEHISDWIWKRRLETAAERLGDPACAHLSIQDLAYRCGFSTQSHFTRRFRDFYGMPPGEFRRKKLIDKLNVNPSL